MKIKQIEEALGKVVVCKDGYKRRLRRLEPEFGSYAYKVSGAWWLSGKVEIDGLKQLFKNAIIVEGEKDK